jgi:predicted extracellular nuclease
VSASQRGVHELSCRATDAAGNTQPLEPPWSVGGYINNAVQQVQVVVRKAERSPRAGWYVRLRIERGISMPVLRRFVVAASVAGFVVPAAAPSSHALATDLFFSEYIEGTSNNKALEIFNGTGAAVDLSTGGYSVQMFFNGNPVAGLTINLTGTVAPGDVYVVAQSAASATILAQADQTNGSGWFNGDDAVVLRKGTTVLDVIGQIGFDPGTEWGAGLTSTADNTLQRKSTICAGDTNGSDAFDPSVEWDGFATDTFTGLGSHPDPCGGGDAAPQVTSTSPANGAGGVAADSNVSVTFSEAVTVSPTGFDLSCTTSGTHAAAVSGGPTTFTLDPAVDFAFAESCTLTVDGSQVSDQDTADPPDTMTANFVATFATEAAPIPIHDIQQATQRSSVAGGAVTTTGVVTAKASNGFYLQAPDAEADTDEATSEAIFVFTSSPPTVQVGDGLKVSGTVSEFRPGGAASTNLTTTEITGPSVVVQSSGNPLPAATVIGPGGRVPPTQVIEDDATGDVETSGVFDPEADGIDFYESLEAMRVQVNDPIAVGPTNAFGEIPVVLDGGANASVRTARDGIIVRPTDFNPERVFLDDTLVSNGTPDVNVGDGFTTPAVGVLDYSFGNFKLNVTQALTRVDNGLTREVTSAPAAGELAVATFNVENLSPNDPPSKFDALADEIVNHLLSPDVIALEEIQDNSGATDNGVVDADVTLTQLVAAIVAAGGPAYDWRQINPVDDQDGGQPGGNIRQGLLFRTDRGVAFVDRPGGSPTTPTSAVNGASGPELSVSPGRIDPANTAWGMSRKPLAGEFTYRGETVFVIANHFNSKGGDDPLFGRFQPPTRISEVQRHQQAQVVNDFVDSILAVDGAANIVVLGDINDFDFSDTVSILKGDVLHNLMDTLPPDERYSYVFEGNSQVLDQILVSSGLDIANPAFDPVHINAEFFDQQSDHDPSVTLVDFDKVWTFTGFLAPVDNGAVLNSVKAGQGVPVRFQLGGDRGLDILAPGSPTSVRIACGSGVPVDPIEETVTTGASGLQYDAATGTYTYVWKTLKSWNRTCRHFTLQLDDGTVRSADFEFK